jgi:hypothetical protein
LAFSGGHEGHEGERKKRRKNFGETRMVKKADKEIAEVLTREWEPIGNRQV